MNRGDKAKGIKCPECFGETLVKNGHYKDGRIRWLCTSCFRSTIFPITTWPPSQEELDKEAGIWKVPERKAKPRNHGIKKNVAHTQYRKSHKGPRTNQLIRRNEVIDHWLHNTPTLPDKVEPVEPERKMGWEERYGVAKATEMRKKASLRMKKKYQDDPSFQELMAANRAKVQADPEICRRRVENMKGKPKLGIRGDKHWTRTPEGGKKVAESKRKAWTDPNHTYNTPEYRESLSRGQKSVWENPEYIERRRKLNGAKPNNQEMKLIRLLHDVCPKEFAYNGNLSLCTVIGGKIPDFLNINGRKQVIEFFGDWWHSEKFTGVPEEKAEKDMIEHYKQLGFDCLIIWERELSESNRETLVARIKEFTRG